MRIISGTVGGRSIAAPPGSRTRPTSDRVREAIFNILLSRGPLPDQVLDLYAGSGAMGLEALSRGVRAATFVEHHGPTADLVRTNADSLAMTSRVHVVRARVTEWLSSLREAPFGWVFVDPPYDSPELTRCLELLGQLAGRGELDSEALVVAEHAVKTVPPLEDRYGALARVDRRTYGQTAVSFYARLLAEES